MITPQVLTVSSVFSFRTTCFEQNDFSAFRSIHDIEVFRIITRILIANFLLGASLAENVSRMRLFQIEFVLLKNNHIVLNIFEYMDNKDLFHFRISVLRELFIAFS